jgi:hypothetical protein
MRLFVLTALVNIARLGTGDAATFAHGDFVFSVAQVTSAACA